MSTTPAKKPSGPSDPDMAVAEELPTVSPAAPAPACDRKRLSTKSRIDLMLELSERYDPHRRGPGLQLRFWWKKYAWVVVVGGAKLVKRALDVAVSGLMLILLLPLFALIAIGIKLGDRGPILFWQARVGRWGREFPFPKFRSMVPNAEQLRCIVESHHVDSITFKAKNDPRVTRLGRVLRKFSLDELPQLWCVLKGEMSLVGPRPPLPSEVAQYTLTDRRRLDVVPGLTCIWQTSGRSTLPFAQQLELDVQYIQSQSLWLDFKLLLKTIPAVLSGKGAH
jgi:lipopolysaccharide/colanic/teichoic acid biosynthesis glycosyltransferase